MWYQCKQHKGDQRMTISSLQDLNNYALTPITYTDLRTAQVIFDRGATVDQELTINENNTFVFPWGININDITQYDVAEVQYEIDLTNFTSPVNVEWGTLPAHVTTQRVGTTNVWLVEDIRSASDWLAVRNATVTPEFGFSGDITLRGTISYYSDNQDSSRTQVGWDVDLTVNAVQYFTTAPTLEYVSYETKTDMSTVSITNAGPGSFDPDWTLRISATPEGSIVDFDADGSPAEITFDESTGVFTIIGDTTAVNAILATMDVTFGRSDAQVLIRFELSNNLSSSQEVAIQVINSTDFISDQTTQFGTSAIPKIYLGVVADVAAIANTTIFAMRFRDPGSITLSGVASGSQIDPPSLATANIIARPVTTMNAEFTWYFPYYWLEAQVVSSLSCSGINQWDISSVTGSGYILDDKMLAPISSSEYKVYDLSNRTLSTNRLNAPVGYENFGDSGKATAMNSSVAIIGDYIKDVGTGASALTDHGILYRYDLSNGNLTTIDNPDVYPATGSLTAAERDYFGYAVGMNSGTTGWYIVGAPAESNSSTDHANEGGAAYIFNANGTVRHSIPNPSPSTSVDEEFGGAVDISEDYAIISATRNQPGGSVYVYDPDSGSLLRTINNPNSSGSGFGTTVKISNNQYGVIYESGQSNIPSVSVYDLSTGNQVWQHTHTTAVSSITNRAHMDASDNYVAVGFSNTLNEILVFDITDGTIVHTIDTTPSSFPNVASAQETTVKLSDSYLVVTGSIPGASQFSAIVFEI